MSQYTTGTVTTDGTTAIVGVGTLWASEVATNDAFLITTGVGGDGVVYTIASVTDDTNLVLSAAYAGANVSGKAYAITRDFTPNESLPELAKDDVGTAPLYTRAMRILDTLFTNFTAGVLAILGGGTGATTAAGARTNLSVPAISDTAIQAQTTINAASDATIVVTEAQARNAILNITDTGFILTGATDVELPDAAREWTVVNDTPQTLTFKTSAGTGIAVLAGDSDALKSDGTNVDKQVNGSNAGDLVFERIVSGGAVTSIDITGLDINSHRSYRVNVEANNQTGSLAVYYLTVEGDHTVTNYYRQLDRSSGATPTDVRQNDPGIMIVSAGDRSIATIDLMLNNLRPMAVSHSARDVGSNISIDVFAWSKTADVSSNITSARITSSVAGAIANDSIVRVYRG
jgi:hypothetical protein